MGKKNLKKRQSASAASFNEEIQADAPPAWLMPILRQMQDDSCRREEALLAKLSGHPRHDPVSSSVDMDERVSSTPIDFSGSPRPEHEALGRTMKELVARAASVGRATNAKPPPELDSGISLHDFSGWRARWDDYATLIRLDRLSTREQLAHLRTCLTSNMRATLEHAIDIGSCAPVTDVLDVMHGFLRSQRNVALDRTAFAERRQEAGESFDDFVVALKAIAKNGDLCDHCLEQQMVTRIMCGVRCVDTHRKLLSVHPFPSLKSVMDICRSRKAAVKDNAILSTSKAPEVMVQAAKAEVAPQTKCRYCGGTLHGVARKCPARVTHAGCGCARRRPQHRHTPPNRKLSPYFLRVIE
eukprot:scpid93452/ scgid4530/ 